MVYEQLHGLSLLIGHIFDLLFISFEVIGSHHRTAPKNINIQGLLFIFFFKVLIKLADFCYFLIHSFDIISESLLFFLVEEIEAMVLEFELNLI